MAGKAVVGGNARRRPVIIVRRDEAEEAPHHGGAWKVAYADFVTAMMAFFLLMWLLNATTEQQRTGLADYFAPTNLFGRSASGSGQPFGGRTPNDDGTSVSSDGAPQSIRGQSQPEQRDLQDDDPDAQALSRSWTDATQDDDSDPTLSGPNGKSTAPAQKPGTGHQSMVQGGDYAAARLTPSQTPDPTAQTEAQHERQVLEQTGAQLLDAIRRDPALQDVAGQLMIDNVPEGLRIQVVDADHRPMFALGSSAPTRRVQDLMQKVVPSLIGLPNAIAISGHTDALTYRGQDKGNWELSSERANATRRILVDAGLPDDRIRSVTGNADRDLLLPADPLNPANRRITITVLRHTAAPPAGAAAP